MTAWFLLSLQGFFFFLFSHSNDHLEFYRRCSYVLVDSDTLFRMPSVYWRTPPESCLDDGPVPLRCLGIFSFMCRTPSLCVVLVKEPPCCGSLWRGPLSSLVDYGSLYTLDGSVWHLVSLHLHSSAQGHPGKLGWSPSTLPALE